MPRPAWYESSGPFFQYLILSFPSAFPIAVRYLQQSFLGAPHRGFAKTSPFFFFPKFSVTPSFLIVKLCLTLPPASFPGVFPSMFLFIYGVFNHICFLRPQLPLGAALRGLSFSVSVSASLPWGVDFDPSFDLCRKRFFRQDASRFPFSAQMRLAPSSPFVKVPFKDFLQVLNSPFAYRLPLLYPSPSRSCTNFCN